jgi:hypothetical protein
MKALKIVILLLGILGIVGLFLPYMKMGNEAFKMWDAHKTDDKMHVYIPLAGFALAALMGLLATAKGAAGRLHGILAFIGFGLTMAIKEVRMGLSGLEVAPGVKMDTQIGGKIIFVAAVVGMLVSIIATAKPEKA